MNSKLETIENLRRETFAALDEGVSWLEVNEAFCEALSHWCSFNLRDEDLEAA